MPEHGKDCEYTVAPQQTLSEYRDRPDSEYSAYSRGLFNGCKTFWRILFKVDLINNACLKKSFRQAETLQNCFGHLQLTTYVIPGFDPSICYCFDWTCDKKRRNLMASVFGECLSEMSV